MALEMEIQEVFQFSNGTLVLLGRMSGDGTLKFPCTADVFVGGEFLSRIEITSERMPGPRLERYQRVLEASRSGLDPEILKSARLIFSAGQNSTGWEEQAAKLASEDDPNPEHYRYWSFRLFLSVRSSISEAEMERYIELATEDPEHAMGQSALLGLACWKNLTDAQYQTLSGHMAFQEDVFRRALIRGQLVRDLMASRVTDENCDALIKDGEAVLQRMLLERRTLSREQLERLKESGRSRAVRNMAAAMLRTKAHRRTD